MPPTASAAMPSRAVRRIPAVQPMRAKACMPRRRPTCETALTSPSDGSSLAADRPVAG